ncbi:hypothetical protein LSH36_5g18063 [Paralvinella palmiformis]|uniref:Annexin n=1 Tax=Paralvinella palmiformis TaxID=53620 RepID=A0AAD9KEU4_9ANNE|nr:hypothetical protein LSH36_5g18063 [Paralvinella palmiformis]
MGCAQSHKTLIDTKGAKNTNQQPHLELPKQYDVTLYTKCLKGAIDEGDAAYLLRALLNCDEDQKKDLNNSYSNTHGQSLLEQISSSSTKYNWRPWIAFISELLLSSKHKSSMMYIKSLLDSDPISESKLVQVLCSHGDDDVQAILRCYEDDTGRSLVNEINCKFQAESAEALCAFLTKKEEFDVSPSDYASNLIESATDNKLFKDNRLFFSYLRTVPSDKLKDIFEMFLRQCQRDLTVEIEKHYPAGIVQDTLKKIVSVIRNAPLERVNRIHELLNSTEDDHDVEELCFLILSPTLGHMTELKQVYKTTHFDMLAKDIKDQTTDDILKIVLLHAVK